MNSGESTTQEAFDVSELYRQSIGLRLLYDVLGGRLTVPGACFTWCAVQSSVFFAVCGLMGNLSLPRGKGQMGLVQDHVHVGLLFAVPFGFLVLYYCLRRFARYLTEIGTVLETSLEPQAHRKLLEFARHSFTRKGTMKWITRAAFTAGLVAVIFNTISNSFPDRFYGCPDKWDGTAFIGTYVLNRLYVLVAWGYVVPTWLIAVVTQLAVMTGINLRIAKEGWLKIEPFHPDGIAGMRPLASSALAIGYSVLPAALYMATPIFRGVHLHWGNYVSFSLFGLLAAVIAVVPISVLHFVMKKRKSEILTPASLALRNLNAEFARRAMCGDIEGLADEKLAKALDAAQKFHTLALEMPVWPFNVSILSRLFATLIAPTMLLIIERLVRMAVEV